MTAEPTRLFASTVEQYDRYRTGYPAAAVADLARTLGLDRTRRVADIGCGTGQLALPLAGHAGAVTAIDPLPEMLALGRRNAAAAGIDNIAWVVGDSTRLDTVIPSGTDVATFAASFHWTDRAAVVGTLDRLLGPTGAVVVIHEDADAAEPDWVQAITEVRTRWLGDDHTAAVDPYTRPPTTHRDVLAASPFSSVHQLTWSWDRRLGVDEAVGLQFTYSVSTPAVFGERAGGFAADARAAILRLHPDGYVTEAFRMDVLVATRPV